MSPGLSTLSTFQRHARIQLVLLALFPGLLWGCTKNLQYVQSYERMTAFKTVKWPQRGGLQLEAYYIWRQVNSIIDPPPNAIVRAYAINISPRPISVATQPTFSCGGGRDAYVIIAEWIPYCDPSQRPQIPSASDLHIVTLFSNECALIAEYDLRDRGGLLDPYDLDKSSVWFRYEVPAEWGERFGIWSGKITAPLIPWPEWPYTRVQENTE